MKPASARGAATAGASALGAAVLERDEAGAVRHARDGDRLLDRAGDAEERGRVGVGLDRARPPASASSARRRSGRRRARWCAAGGRAGGRRAPARPRARSAARLRIAAARAVALRRVSCGEGAVMATGWRTYRPTPRWAAVRRSTSDAADLHDLAGERHHVRVPAAERDRGRAVEGAGDRREPAVAIHAREAAAVRARQACPRSPGRWASPRCPATARRGGGRSPVRRRPRAARRTRSRPDPSAARARAPCPPRGDAAPRRPGRRTACGPRPRGRWGRRCRTPAARSPHRCARTRMTRLWCPSVTANPPRYGSSAYWTPPLRTKGVLGGCITAQAPMSATGVPVPSRLMR